MLCTHSKLGRGHCVYSSQYLHEETTVPLTNGMPAPLRVSSCTVLHDKEALLLITAMTSTAAHELFPCPLFRLFFPLLVSQLLPSSSCCPTPVVLSGGYCCIWSQWGAARTSLHNKCGILCLFYCLGNMTLSWQLPLCQVTQLHLETGRKPPVSWGFPAGRHWADTGYVHGSINMQSNRGHEPSPSSHCHWTDHSLALFNLANSLTVPLLRTGAAPAHGPRFLSSPLLSIHSPYSLQGASYHHPGSSTLLWPSHYPKCLCVSISLHCPALYSAWERTDTSPLAGKSKH